MSIKRKKIILFSFFLFLLSFFFVENNNIIYAQESTQSFGVESLKVNSPQGVDVSKGDSSTFLTNFCHVTPGSNTLFGQIYNVGQFLYCLILYIVSMIVRLPLFIIVLILWALVWLMAALGALLNNLFIVIIGASLITNNLNPERLEIFEFTKAIGNGLVILAGVMVGLATVLKIEEYSIKKHFGKLIALIVLVNYSHYLVIAATTTANEIAKPFFEALKSNKKTINIIVNIWNETSARNVSIKLPYTAGEIFGSGEITELPLGLNSIPAVVMDYIVMRDSYFLKYFVPNVMLIIAVCIYLFIYFTMFFALTSCFLYFALYGFIRVFMILILGILAPLAFSTIIFERSQVYKVLFPGFLKWDNWLQSVLTWSFLVVPLLFIFFFGDQLYDAVNQFQLGETLRKTIEQLTTSSTGITTSSDIGITGSEYLSDAINQLLSLFADMAPAVAIFIFYTIAFAEVKNQIKNMTAGIVGNLTAGIPGMLGLAGWTAGGIALGAGVAGGALSSLGFSTAGGFLSKAGQLPGKALSSLAGKKGEAWSKKAEEWREKGESIGKTGIAALGLAGKGVVKLGLGLGYAVRHPVKAGKAIYETTGKGISAVGRPVVGAGVKIARGVGKGATYVFDEYRKTFVKKAKPEDFKEQEFKRAQESTPMSWEGLLSEIQADFSPNINKLRSASVLSFKNEKNLLTQRGKEIFMKNLDKLLNDYETKDDFTLGTLAEVAHMEDLYKKYRGGIMPDKFEEESRKIALRTLRDKSSTPEEKAYALQILAESKKNLTQEESNFVSRALPYVQLDSDNALKLALKSPSLAPELGIPIERVIAQARFNQERNAETGKLTDIPAFELQNIYHLLNKDDKSIILRQGSPEQKTQMIELMLKDLSLNIHHEYTTFLTQEKAQTPEEKLEKTPLFFLNNKVRMDIEKALDEKVAKIEEKDKKKEAKKEMMAEINSIIETLKTQRQGQTP